MSFRKVKIQYHKIKFFSLPIKTDNCNVKNISPWFKKNYIITADFWFFWLIADFGPFKGRKKTKKSNYLCECLCVSSVDYKRGLKKPIMWFVPCFISLVGVHTGLLNVFFAWIYILVTHIANQNITCVSTDECIKYTLQQGSPHNTLSY